MVAAAGFPAASAEPPESGGAAPRPPNALGVEELVVGLSVEL